MGEGCSSRSWNSNILWTRIKEICCTSVIGIIDVDTNELLDIASGETVTANIISILKGQNGNPGKIQGSIEGGQTVGTIYKNTAYGIYGHIDNTSGLFIDKNNLVPIALRNEIKTGDAVILSTLENGKTVSYDIKIEKIYLNNNIDNKSMIIRITDDELLEKTGGIIQGMSGSPILQHFKMLSKTPSPLTQLFL